VHYLDFLHAMHQLLRPPTYLEIGVRHGDSLALARRRAIGVDPRPRVRVQLGAGTRLYRQTSDEFFARKRPLRHFEGRAPALAFIDGLHHAEIALRDFIAVERLMRWHGVVVLDDVLPREAGWASRERTTASWTGDVFKLPDVLARHRPDLLQLKVDTEPSGLLIVFGPDRRSTVLADRYDALAAELATPDPQAVPVAVLERRGALDADTVLASGLWRALRDARGERMARAEGMAALRKAVKADFGRLSGLVRRLRGRA